MARAQADLNLWFRSCFRSIWPRKSHNSSFLCKYHIAIVFCHFRLYWGYNIIYLILLHRRSFLYISLLPLTSRHLWDKKYYIVGLVMAIGQGNFHIKENGLKFTNFWELKNLSKSAEFHLNTCVDFISDPTFWTWQKIWKN